jgi:hypothetical protein
MDQPERRPPQVKKTVLFPLIKPLQRPLKEQALYHHILTPHKTSKFISFPTSSHHKSLIRLLALAAPHFSVGREIYLRPPKFAEINNIFLCELSELCGKNNRI